MEREKQIQILEDRAAGHLANAKKYALWYAISAAAPDGYPYPGRWQRQAEGHFREYLRCRRKAWRLKEYKL